MPIEVGENTFTGSRLAVQGGRSTIGGSVEPSYRRASEGDLEVLDAGQRLVKLGHLITLFGCVITLLGIEAVRLRERDDRSNNGDAACAVEVSNECLVDLQHIKRQVGQTREGAVAGPEVVDRDPGAEVADSGQRVDRV